MKSVELVLFSVSGTLLFTAGIVLARSFEAGLMVGMAIGFWGAVARAREMWPAWFQQFTFLFTGTSFLIGHWWLIAHGKHPSPALFTFGPGFLVIGL